jgi:hypothetical protein
VDAARLVMKLYALSITLAFGVISSSALKIPFRQAKRSPLQRRNGGATVSVARPGSALANAHVLATAPTSNSFDIKYVQALSYGRFIAIMFFYSSVHDLIYLANVSACSCHGFVGV